MRRVTVTDNPFLVGIMHQGARETIQQCIIEALEENFGEVPEDIRASVNRITDQDI